jgi:hypothetical protein
MASIRELRERITALAYELAVEEAGETDDTSALSWLDAVESRAAEIGDMLAAEVVRQKAVLRPPQENESLCPQCGQPGRYQGKQERPLLTRRGPTTIVEPKYHCPCCRKDFFPDGQSDRR